MTLKFPLLYTSYKGPVQVLETMASRARDTISTSSDFKPVYRTVMIFLNSLCRSSLTICRKLLEVGIENVMLPRAPVGLCFCGWGTLGYLCISLPD